MSSGLTLPQFMAYFSDPAAEGKTRHKKQSLDVEALRYHD